MAHQTHYVLKYLARDTPLPSLAEAKSLCSLLRELSRRQVPLRTPSLLQSDWSVQQFVNQNRILQRSSAPPPQWRRYSIEKLNVQRVRPKVPFRDHPAERGKSPESDRPVEQGYLVWTRSHRQTSSFRGARRSR